MFTRRDLSTHRLHPPRLQHQPLIQQVSVSAAIVRWVRGEDFGVETLVLNGKAQAQLRQYISERMKAL